jgi:hypothetical protein
MKHVRLRVQKGDHDSRCNTARGKHIVACGDNEHVITASELPIVLDALRAYRGVTHRDEVLDDLIDALDII